GNDNSVLIDGDGGTTTTLLVTNATFPVTIDPPPSGAYPGTTGDVYEFDAEARTYTTSGIANAGLSFGQAAIWEEYDHSVTLP
ncbi:MAG TPA: hypothetical protein VFR02_00370, partial [bacterium]|nr:hypothetical protein [bacterium]